MFDLSKAGWQGKQERGVTGRHKLWWDSGGADLGAFGAVV